MVLIGAFTGERGAERQKGQTILKFIFGLRHDVSARREALRG
jgi:hypothetical protein